MNMKLAEAVATIAKYTPEELAKECEALVAACKSLPKPDAGGGVFFTPDSICGAGGFLSKLSNVSKANAMHDTEHRIAKTPYAVVFNFEMPHGRKISGQIIGDSATLFDGENVVCRMTFFDKYAGRNWTFPVVRRALNGILSKAGHRIRNAKNRDKRTEVLYADKTEGDR